MELRNILCAAALSCFVGTVHAQKKVDVLIKNAWVFNGDGKDSVYTNVGISGDRISYIGKNEIAAKETIDANGRYLSPGFIDPHTHANGMIENKKDNSLMPWLMQGVTTIIIGADGGGPYDVASHVEKYQNIGVGANFGFFVGFGPVRKKVLGQVNVQPNASQLSEMKKLVAQGMREGAVGFSTGLIYLPQMYSKTNEVKELYAEAAKYGAVYDSHMRNESNGVLRSIDELIKIGDGTDLPLHISHIKVSGENNWGRAQEVVDKVNEARAKGVNLTANHYPFEASMTSLRATVLPQWAQEGGNAATLARFENPEERTKIIEHLNLRSEDRYKRILIMSRGKSSDAFRGKSIFQISQEMNLPFAEAIIEIFKQTKMAASVVNFGMGKEDIETFVKQPWIMTGSDGGGLHPRTYATFTKIIEDFVVKKPLISMSQAIHRATQLTANTFSIKDRGEIKEGKFADIILFSPNNIKAKSTYIDPEQLSEGIDFMFVNGVKVIREGKYTGKLEGKFIKK
jgi:N-acyl-D-amino-acid deacylase